MVNFEDKVTGLQAGIRRRRVRFDAANHNALAGVRNADLVGDIGGQILHGQPPIRSGRTGFFGTRQLLLFELRHRYFDRGVFTAANYLDRHFLANPGLRHQFRQFVLVMDYIAREFDDDIPAFDPGLKRRTGLVHSCYQGADRLRQAKGLGQCGSDFLDLDAQAIREPPGHASVAGP